jgi:putative spermidine/putrescine transport system ATP-binding protein
MSQGRVEQLGTPTEVYRTPTTAFVARFVGSMNELPAQVAGSDAVTVLDLVVPTPGASALSAGASATLLVRPEDLVISESGLVGTVASITFQGASTLVGVRLDVLDVVADVHVAGIADLNPGERVQVAIDGSRAVCEPMS